jgi:hypothetical protein
LKHINELYSVNYVFQASIFFIQMGFLTDDPFGEIQTQLLSLLSSSMLALLFLKQIDPKCPLSHSLSLGSYVMGVLL